MSFWTSTKIVRRSFLFVLVFVVVVVVVCSVFICLFVCFSSFDIRLENKSFTPKAGLQHSVSSLSFSALSRCCGPVDQT